MWTQILLDVLAAVGVEEKSARQALARTAADGVVGLRARGPPGALVALGGGPASAQSRAPPASTASAARTATWDGRWLMLVASVPEAQRSRTPPAADPAGLGRARLAAPGVWVSPDPASRTRSRGVLAELGLHRRPARVVGDYLGGLGRRASSPPGPGTSPTSRPATPASSTAFAALAPADDTADARPAQIQLVDAWRRFPFLDPGLPDALLPRPWVGHRAGEVFHTHHEQWAPAATRRFAALAGTP